MILEVCCHADLIPGTEDLIDWSGYNVWFKAHFDKEELLECNTYEQLSGLIESKFYESDCCYRQWDDGSIQELTNDDYDRCLTTMQHSVICNEWHCLDENGQWVIHGEGFDEPMLAEELMR